MKCALPEPGSNRILPGNAFKSVCRTARSWLLLYLVECGGVWEATTVVAKHQTTRTFTCQSRNTPSPSYLIHRPIPETRFHHGQLRSHPCRHARSPFLPFPRRSWSPLIASLCVLLHTYHPAVALVSYSRNLSSRAHAQEDSFNSHTFLCAYTWPRDPCRLSCGPELGWRRTSRMQIK